MRKGVRTATLFKLETLAQVFSCEFCEFSKSTFFTEHVWVTASLICGKNTRKFINSLLYSYQLFLSVKAKVFPEEID